MPLFGLLISLLSLTLIHCYDESPNNPKRLNLPIQQKPLSVPYYPNAHNVVPSIHNDFLQYFLRLEELEKRFRTLQDKLSLHHQDIAIEGINDSTSICEDFYTALYVDSHCYSYETDLDGLTFEEAKDYCIYKGGHLAVPVIPLWTESQFQADFVAAFGSNLGPMWVGANSINMTEVIGLDGTDLTSLLTPNPSFDGGVTLTVANGVFSYSVNLETTLRTNYICEYS